MDGRDGLPAAGRAISAAALIRASGLNEARVASRTGTGGKTWGDGNEERGGDDEVIGGDEYDEEEIGVEFRGCVCWGTLLVSVLAAVLLTELGTIEDDPIAERLVLSPYT